MPLIKRQIEPTELSRARIGQGIRNELECVTNNTLANVIRQLSSLSKHAEDMFGELTREATTVFQRAHNLQDRIDKLRVKVTQLDSTVAVVSLQEIHMRKPFKSSVIREQQIISKESRPAAIQESYEKCDAPPALSKLNVYREDGKDSMKFYTDSTYFFELWRQEIVKDTEHSRQEYNKRRAEKKMHHHLHHYDVPNVLHSEHSLDKRPMTRAPVAIKQVERKDYTPYAQGKELADYQQQQQREKQQKAAAQQKAGGAPQNLRDGDYITPNNTAAQIQPHNGQYRQNNSHVGNHVGQPTHTATPQHMQNGPVHHNMHPQQYNNTGGADYIDADSDYQQQNTAGSSSHHTSPVKPHHPGNEPGAHSPQHSRPASPPPLPPAEPNQGGRYRVSSRALPSPPPPPESPRDHHTSSPGRDGAITPGSLPPPSPPPIYGGNDSMNSMPSPPPSPPPMGGATASPPHAGSPPGGRVPNSPPPPPPVPGVPPPPAMAPVNNISGAGAAKKKPAVDIPEPQDGRSDLLEAIRRGIQLRQVQARQEVERRKSTSNKLDVQAIMEAAFEMRRKAMEEGSDDDEGDESGGDDEWLEQ